MPPPQHSLVYTPTSPLLFRYSALTFNAHKIHYDIEWTRKMEGHPDLVVHGPMTATLLVERADKLAGDAGLQLQRFEYRATSPMYVDREITLQAVFDQRNKTALLWAEQDGNVGMKATATFV
jgi:hydroxyacyl-ACP dehydratase HTD2-like protein with hotdog domain